MTLLTYPHPIGDKNGLCPALCFNNSSICQLIRLLNVGYKIYKIYRLCPTLLLQLLKNNCWSSGLWYLLTFHKDFNTIPLEGPLRNIYSTMTEKHFEVTEL